jgi:hypothetical protein
MFYTSRLWNGNYLNYELILPKERKLRKSLHIIVVPFVIIYIGFCCVLLSGTLLFDGYRIARFKYYKNDKSLFRLFNSTNKWLTKKIILDPARALNLYKPAA